MAPITIAPTTHEIMAAGPATVVASQAPNSHPEPMIELSPNMTKLNKLILFFSNIKTSCVWFAIITTIKVVYKWIFSKKTGASSALDSVVTVTKKVGIKFLSTKKEECVISRRYSED
ncbi:conserved hypothetical protein [Latilactobacillus sakei]|nr:conserved hypothetical protein [Latilactobacillus sakei]